MSKFMVANNSSQSLIARFPVGSVWYVSLFGIWIIVSRLQSIVTHLSIRVGKHLLKHQAKIHSNLSIARDEFSKLLDGRVLFG